MKRKKKKIDKIKSRKRKKRRKWRWKKKKSVDESEVMSSLCEKQFLHFARVSSNSLPCRDLLFYTNV